MDYEKLHKESLRIAQRLVDEGRLTVDVVKRILPDFAAENDDERIRKMLIERVRNAEELNEELRERIIAYLEKQKEQKPVEWSDEDKKMLQSLLHDYEYAIQSSGTVWGKDFEKKHNWLEDLPNRFTLQPKQEWSEEDKKKLNGITNCLCCTSGDIDGFGEWYDWLKDLPNRFALSNWKPSEEQMEALMKTITWLVEKGNYTDSSTLADLRRNLQKLL